MNGFLSIRNAKRFRFGVPNTHAYNHNVVAICHRMGLESILTKG